MHKRGPLRSFQEMGYLRENNIWGGIYGRLNKMGYNEISSRKIVFAINGT